MSYGESRTSAPCGDEFCVCTGEWRDDRAPFGPCRHFHVVADVISRPPPPPPPPRLCPFRDPGVSLAAQFDPRAVEPFAELAPTLVKNIQAGVIEFNRGNIACLISASSIPGCVEFQARSKVCPSSACRARISSPAENFRRLVSPRKQGAPIVRRHLSPRTASRAFEHSAQQKAASFSGSSRGEGALGQMISIASIIGYHNTTK